MTDQQSNIPENSTQEIPYGYCHCGCGRPAPISERTHNRYGWIKGKPKRFIRGHAAHPPPVKKGELHPCWKGGKSKSGDGYVLIYFPEHPRANLRGYVREHVLVAEKVLGKALPPKAIPHHIDHDHANNKPSNLVICQDNAYHRLIHRREKALRACGHVNWRKCRFCKKHDDPKDMDVSGFHVYHRACKRIYESNHQRTGG